MNKLTFNKNEFAYYKELKNIKIKTYKEFYCFIEELQEMIDLQGGL